LDRSRGGLGLGLSLVRALVRLHGGEVMASSQGPGLGAEFVVRLPLSSVSEAERPASRPAPHRRRVLIIEDNEDAAETVREVLSLAGHAVLVARDGPGGIRLGREFLPDLVLCDIGLPGLDGYAVARAFRADPQLRDAYLVAVSGYATPEVVDRARSAGFDRHVVKPLDGQQLQDLAASAPVSPADAAPA
ncbi:MAG TPA: hybrid sensor histidine kinase/response regulator, partial [Anaeromyxobacter sp.]|nr:hybrid sensor histidine kinase/response regulator [Anaeromyxobacter sp.]